MTLVSEPDPYSGLPVGKQVNTWPASRPSEVKLIGNFGHVEKLDARHEADLWQAVQSHEISGKEALIMGLAQRGMNTPYPEQAPGPNVPLGPTDPAAGLPPAPAAPAPAPVLPGTPLPPA